MQISFNVYKPLEPQWTSLDVVPCCEIRLFFSFYTKKYHQNCVFVMFVVEWWLWTRENAIFLNEMVSLIFHLFLCIAKIESCIDKFQPNNEMTETHINKWRENKVSLLRFVARNKIFVRYAICSVWRQLLENTVRMRMSSFDVFHRKFAALFEIHSPLVLFSTVFIWFLSTSLSYVGTNIQILILRISASKIKTNSNSEDFICF